MIARNDYFQVLHEIFRSLPSYSIGTKPKKTRIRQTLQTIYISSYTRLIYSMYIFVDLCLTCLSHFLPIRSYVFCLCLSCLKTNFLSLPEHDTDCYMCWPFSMFFCYTLTRILLLIYTTHIHTHMVWWLCRCAQSNAKHLSWLVLLFIHLCFKWLCYFFFHWNLLLVLVVVPVTCLCSKRGMYACSAYTTYACACCVWLCVIGGMSCGPMQLYSYQFCLLYLKVVDIGNFLKPYICLEIYITFASICAEQFTQEIHAFWCSSVKGKPRSRVQGIEKHNGDSLTALTDEFSYFFNV